MAGGGSIHRFVRFQPVCVAAALKPEFDLFDLLADQTEAHRRPEVHAVAQRSFNLYRKQRPEFFRRGVAFNLPARGADRYNAPFYEFLTDCFSVPALQGQRLTAVCTAAVKLPPQRFAPGF